MKKRMKQLAVVGLTGAMLLGSSMTAFAGTWTVDGAVQTQQAAGIDLSWVRNEDGILVVHFTGTIDDSLGAW